MWYASQVERGRQRPVGWLAEGELQRQGRLQVVFSEMERESEVHCVRVVVAVSLCRVRRDVDGGGRIGVCVCVLAVCSGCAGNAWGDVRRKLSALQRGRRRRAMRVRGWVVVAVGESEERGV